MRITIKYGRHELFFKSLTHSYEQVHYKFKLYVYICLTLAQAWKNSFTCYSIEEGDLNNGLNNSYDWMSDCCLMPTQQFFSYIMARTSSNFQWDDDVNFILDQHASLDFYNASSLKQQSAEFYQITARTHDLPYSSQARWPLHHRCGSHGNGCFQKPCNNCIYWIIKLELKWENVCFVWIDGMILWSPFPH